MNDTIFVCHGKRCCDKCKVIPTSFSQVLPTACLYGKEDAVCDWRKEKVTEAARDQKLPKLTVEVFDRPDCPELAKFAAVDEDGNAYWFKEKPFISIGKYWSIYGRIYRIDGKFEAFDWKNSLIERPVKLPDWIKVGAWVWTERTGYFRIEEIEGGSCICGKSLNGDGQTVLGEPVLEARLRPWTFEEAPVTPKFYIGKVKYFGYLSFAVRPDTSLFYRCVGSDNSCNYMSFDYIAANGKQIDGSPCGVLEHKNESGEWVR